MCFTLPAGIVTLILAAVIYKVLHVIEVIFHLAWMITCWLAITAAAAAAAVVLGAALMVIWWTGCKIRAWQKARGACMDCDHPCSELAGPARMPWRARLGARIAGQAVPEAIDRPPADLPIPVVRRDDLVA
jgi:hypothetical protein